MSTVPRKILELVAKHAPDKVEYVEDKSDKLAKELVKDHNSAENDIDELVEWFACMLGILKAQEYLNPE